MAMQPVRALMNALRQGSFTSIGCYPLYILMSDGGTLHPNCVRENLFQVARSTRDALNDGWTFSAIDVNWEDPDMFCDECNKRIESAYAEPEEEKNQ